MKKLLIALVVVAGVTLSCKKESKTAVLHRNCTGTYLEIDDKMSRVCNFELLESYEQGDEVEVEYKKIKSCSAYNWTIVCSLFFPYDQDIAVSSVK